MDFYTGIIVEESLEGNRIINNFDIIKVRISNEEKKEHRWHIYTVKISKKDIENLPKAIKSRWYMHFWKGRDIIVIFKNKKFEFDYDNKSTWKPAVNYGLSLGIPREQLDFALE